MSLCLQVQKLLRQKQLEIEDFSVYWDTECQMLGKLPTHEIQVCNTNSNVFVSSPVKQDLTS